MVGKDTDDTPDGARDEEEKEWTDATNFLWLSRSFFTRLRAYYYFSLYGLESDAHAMTWYLYLRAAE